MEVEILAEIVTNSGKKEGKKTLVIRLKKAVIELLFDFSKKEIVKYFLFTVSLLPLYF
jgi:hypothetical protein